MRASSELLSRRSRFLSVARCRLTIRVAAALSTVSPLVVLSTTAPSPSPPLLLAVRASAPSMSVEASGRPLPSCPSRLSCRPPPRLLPRRSSHQPLLLSSSFWRLLSLYVCVLGHS
ncbi:hypothetical protein Scep_019642 [Stephania cephalantha]|uniref:Uncharacterized protein n=1 Tax=Stephania cephalantha TaxID=152367 RepID=A0AAP0IB90_9MAGN